MPSNQESQSAAAVIGCWNYFVWGIYFFSRCCRLWKFFFVGLKRMRSCLHGEACNSLLLNMRLEHFFAHIVTLVFSKTLACTFKHCLEVLLCLTVPWSPEIPVTILRYLDKWLTFVQRMNISFSFFFFFSCYTFIQVSWILNIWQAEMFPLANKSYPSH